MQQLDIRQDLDSFAGAISADGRTLQVMISRAYHLGLAGDSRCHNRIIIGIGGYDPRRGWWIHDKCGGVKGGTA